MSNQIVYDSIGNFQSIVRTDANGFSVWFGPGSSLWPDYVGQFGVPPPTGTPTYPAPALPANIQTAIANLCS